jgi:putative Mg2+ transporter-C (MgtC) family protein
VGIIDAVSFQYQVLVNVALAALLGALIGLDREFADKPAGLRTHILVAGAAALLVALSDVTIRHFSLDLGPTVVRADPIRIMEAVITGVSFLGAGTIIRHGAKNRIEGLTTAASILMSAAVGIAVALSQWVLAIGVTLLVLITLRGMGLVEQWLFKHKSRREHESQEKMGHD